MSFFISGCLDYIKELESLFQDISHQSRKVIYFYCDTDKFSPINERRNRGWVNDLSNRQILKSISRLGMTLSHSERLESMDMIFVFENKTKMAKIIINSTAVRNNGDVALVTTLANALENRGHTVTIATPNAKEMREIQNKKNLCQDVLGYKHPIFRKRILRDLAALICLLASSTYRKADAIIGAPGGYINSYYGYTWRRSVYRWARRFGKKTAIYSQSIGPLYGEDRDNFAGFSDELDILMTRDKLSHNTAISAGFPPERLLPSIDAIFLSRPRYSKISATSDTIGISVRDWTYDKRSSTHFRNMIFEMAEICLDKGFKVEFISTCQGIDNYIDDSALASSIAERLLSKYKQTSSIKVDNKAHSLEDLCSRISTYRLVIGTRLHMCLLSLLQCVPAFNISYESKGKECYDYMGLSDYCIDYNEEEHTFRKNLRFFLDNEATIRESIPQIVSAQHERAKEDFTAFVSRLGVN